MTDLKENKTWGSREVCTFCSQHCQKQRTQYTNRALRSRRPQNDEAM